MHVRYWNIEEKKIVKRRIEKLFPNKSSPGIEEPDERRDTRAERCARAQRDGRAGADASEERAERDHLRTQPELDTRCLSDRQFADVHWPGKRYIFIYS